MNIIYRPAKPADILVAAQVYSTALNDLYQRHGLGDQVVQFTQPNPYYAFCLQEEPEGFWVAESETEIVGMAISWLRGSFWFLGCLFILPTCQQSGIGRNLLDKTLELGSSVTNRALITFPFNRVSTALYMRYGMYPREPIYRMVGDSAVARLAHKETESFNYEKLPPAAAEASRVFSECAGVHVLPLQEREESRRVCLCLVKRSCGSVGSFIAQLAPGRDEYRFGPSCDPGNISGLCHDSGLQ
jgi:ribosomal protein S18 acetylase RimI-like enzyme